ncbi:hypothetical protein F5880DRAFT_1619024 [Lentinula raphanica]|nr:hypothetical protein F5880DRAFT_1619024 [Lentinula raphanica]
MASSSKRPIPKPATTSPSTSSAVVPRKKLSVRPVDHLNFNLVHRVSFHSALRELGQTPEDPNTLFLPASAEECSVLVNNFRRYPNTADPAFSLRRYTHPEDVNFRAVLEQNTEDIRPDTFYPPQLTTFCSTFSTGSVSTAEGFQLYQALAFLQRRFSRIIRGHLSKPEIHRRLISLTSLPNFSDSLEYYQLYWHGRQDCPLAAVVLVLLICEFCEEHLTEGEYASRVYNSKIRDGPGMSLKTRERLLEDIPDSYELESLALPLPLDPSTREGQLILSVASGGSQVDQILHPVTHKALSPDPFFSPSAPSAAPALGTTKAPSKPRLRPPSPDFDVVRPEGSPVATLKLRRAAKKFPVSSSIGKGDSDDELPTSEVFKSPAVPDVLVVRQSIARAAKTKPKIPEEFRKVPTPSPVVKRDRSPADIPPEPPVPEPPTKRRRTQKATGKSRAASPAPVLDDPSLTQDEGPLRIQEGEPDYFHGDDTDVSAHPLFLTNPHFKIKTPFSQLVSKAVETNKRGSKLPFLRPPKWNVSDEMRGFGAFATIGDTTFSLQGLSRFGYASSRFLWPTNNRTLPSPEALYSMNNCLTCISRGEVCESSEKHGGACRQCNGTHRSCPSCLSLEDHRDRFLALHNHVQGYPHGYAAALDQYATALDHMTRVQNTFAPLFQDAQQALMQSMRKVRDSGFDLNVVLSRWAEDNPNLPLDYDTVTWLATLFGWNSSCNLSDYLSSPEEIAKVEAFIRENLVSSTPAEPPLAIEPSFSSHTPFTSVSEPQLPARRRPAAAIPINFSSARQSHTPPASTTADEEMDVEEGTSRASVVHALVTEYDDSDDEEDAEVETDDDVPVEIAPPASLNISKSRK